MPSVIVAPLAGASSSVAARGGASSRRASSRVARVASSSSSFVASSRVALARVKSRASTTRDVRVRAVASPSLPAPPSLPVPDFIRGPLEEALKQVNAQLPADAKRQLLRAQYTTAIGLRLAFFLTQGVLSSRVSGRSNIDAAAAAAAVAKAVLDPEQVDDCLLYTSPSPRD